MSFLFAHPARLTPPICVNACGKNNNVSECWDLWLLVVFCARCFSLFCFFWLWRGEDCVCYYDDKGLRCARTGLKMETPISSIHPSEGVWGSEQKVRACVCTHACGTAQSALLSLKSEPYSRGVSWPSLCGLCGVTLGRALAPRAISTHVDRVSCWSLNNTAALRCCFSSTL